MGTVKFYSKQEIRELRPFLQGKLAVTKENLEPFCKKYERSFGAVGVFIYTTRRKKSPKRPTAKGKGFYSTEERAELTALAESGSPVTTETIKAFCKKYNRSFYSAANTVYRMRKRLGKSKNQKPEKVSTMLKKNEFVIPIYNWEIRKDGDVTNLVLKF